MQGKNKEKHKFKVGDRVAFYDGATRETADVKEIRDDGTLTVIQDVDWEYNAHPKQCRKLKKKESQYLYVVADKENVNDGYYVTSNKSEAEEVVTPEWNNLAVYKVKVLGKV